MINQEQYLTNIKNTLRKHLLTKENIDKRNKVIEVTGISDSSLKQYCSFNYKSIPSPEVIPILCNIFDITIYEYYGIENPSNLSIEEQELIKNYRSQSEHKATVNKIYGMK